MAVDEEAAGWDDERPLDHRQHGRDMIFLRTTVDAGLGIAKTHDQRVAAVRLMRISRRLRHGRIEDSDEVGRAEARQVGVDGVEAADLEGEIRGHARASAASRSAIAGIAAAATLAKAKRRNGSLPAAEHAAGQAQDVLLVGQAPRHRRRRAAVEGMADIGEVSAGADEFVADIVAAEGLAQGRETVAHHLRVAAPPLAERAQAVDRRHLADARRADGDRVHGLGDFGCRAAARRRWRRRDSR